jgi:hypothetical protein
MEFNCKDCGKKATLGIDGVVTVDGNKCDNCAGIQRGLGGFAYEASAKSQGDHCTCFEKRGDNPRCPIHDV